MPTDKSHHEHTEFDDDEGLNDSEDVSGDEAGFGG